MNQADIAVSTVLSELGILSEESKEKICIIQDIVKLSKLSGHPQPTTEEFDYMYDLPVAELELLQSINVQEHHLSLYTKMFYSK